MGPLLFRAEDEALDEAITVLQDFASMGPLLFRAEDRREIRHDTRATQASMGPLLFRAEDQPRAGHLLPRCAASMGPLLFRAEDAGPLRSFSRGTSSFNGAALVQSGRRQVTLSTPASTGRSLQWGRSCSERKTRYLTTGGTAGGAALQWGRSCSERKTSHVSRLWMRETIEASMGPLLFRAEDGMSWPPRDALRRASMGPLLFRAEDE